MEQLQIVSNIGYQALDALSKRRPDLFTSPDHEKLKEAMVGVTKEGSQDKLWAETINLDTSLAPLNENPKEGPVDDALNALILGQALPGLSLREWHNERLWATINCFALGQYVPIRWSSARTRRTVEREFVAAHWLKANTANRESNASMRLFTLHTLAHRIVAYSDHPVEELLNGLAGADDTNVGLFHQTLRRPYLLANSKLMGIIWDSALDDEHRGFLTRAVPASEWLANINERGGAIDLGTLDDGNIRAIVEEAKPRPKAPLPSKQI